MKLIWEDEIKSGVINIALRGIFIRASSVIRGKTRQ